MPVDWKSKESYQRLLAAMVAAHPKDMKLDYRRIARFYGSGATYDSIEGRFRIIRKEAEVLRQEIESDSRPAAPSRGGTGPTTPTSTPKKQRAAANGGVTGGSRKKNGGGAVAGARVEKTPTKRSKNTGPLSAITLSDDDSGIVIKNEDMASTGNASAASSMTESPSFVDEGIHGNHHYHPHHEHHHQANSHHSHSFTEGFTNGHIQRQPHHMSDWTNPASGNDIGDTHAHDHHTHVNGPADASMTYAPMATASANANDEADLLDSVGFVVEDQGIGGYEPLEYSELGYDPMGMDSHYAI